jgi:capsular polysaccharide transport system permease protein
MKSTQGHRIPKNPILEAIVRQKNVMGAVILRDMRTRFFNHGLGFIVVPLWPLTHMAILISMHTLAGHSMPPFGESTAVFYATGLLPTLTFMYVSRFMGYSLLMNKPMLAFPEIRVIDVMMGRAVLEIIGACITLFLIVLALMLFGENPIPFNIEQAVFCYLATILLSVGFGTLIGVVSMFVPMLATVYALVIVIIYLSSGIVFVASVLPEQIGYALSFNPVLVCVEWMRASFYESYSDRLVDRGYVVAWGMGTLMLGLAIDRIFRRQLLEA